MQDLITFFSFADATIRHVVLGCVLLGISASLVGAFAFLRKQTLVGDAVAHAIFPGICLAFLLAGEKKIYLLMLGAFVTGWLALFLVRHIQTHSILKGDSVIALILSVFFAAGIVLLSFIQTTGNPAQSGLNHFLFGNAASLVQEDLVLFNGVAIATLVILWLFMKEFTLISFHRNYAKSLGIAVAPLDVLLTTLMVTSIVIGIQTVGLVLISALLIVPPTIARFWTNRFGIFLLLSALFGVIAAVVGAYISYVAPHMPTGPWIVLVLSGLAVLSFFLAPKGGIVSRWWTDSQLQRKIHQEHMLKVLYKMQGTDKEGDARQQVLFGAHYFSRRVFWRTLRQLRQKRWVLRSARAGQPVWTLTVSGEEAAARVVRRHRLWEVYLTRHMRSSPQDAHAGAESMEHILTAETEAELGKILNYPEKDPHNTPIPYPSDAPKQNK